MAGIVARLLSFRSHVGRWHRPHAAENKHQNRDRRRHRLRRQRDQRAHFQPFAHGRYDRAAQGVATIAISDELAKFATPAAERFFNAELKKGVVAATDGVFLTGLAVGRVLRLPLLAAARRMFLPTWQRSLAAVTTGPNSRLYFIIDASERKKAGYENQFERRSRILEHGHKRRRILPGVTALVTDQLAANTAMLVDATGIIGDTSNVDLRMARHATLHLDSEDSPPDASAGLISLFQHNLRALMAERWFGFEKARSTSVAMLSGVNY